MKSTPRQRRHAKTRQDILEAARQIIASKGLDELSMRELANQIDYSPAGLYEYFNSKEEIIHALSTEGHRRLEAYILQVDENQPPADYLAAIGLAYIDFALRNPEHYLLMFTKMPAKQRVEDLVKKGSSFSILLRAVQRGIEAGVFKTRPGFGLNEMAYAVWSQVHGIAMLRLTYLREFDLDFSIADREAVWALSRGLQNG